MDTILRFIPRLDSSDFIPKSNSDVGYLIADDFFGVATSVYQFGKTSVGATPVAGLTGDSNLGGRFTASQSGTLTKIWAYFKLDVAGTANMRVALFANAGGNIIGSKIAESSGAITVSNTTAGWFGVDISANISSGLDYWLFAWVDTSGISGGSTTYYADANAVSNTILLTFGNSFPSWSTTNDGTNEAYDTAYMSIYGDVTVASAGSYTLTLDSVTFNENGQAMTFRASRLLTASQQSYTLSGQAVNLIYAKTLTLAQASFSLNGQNANLRANRTLLLSQSTFTLSGQVVNLKRALAIAMDKANYTIYGQDVTLRPNRLLSLSVGSFTLSGQTANLKKASSITLAQSVFSLSGQSATLRYNRVLTANSGSFALSGINATLVYNQIGRYTLVAHEGLFTLSGQIVNLNYTPANHYTLSLVKGQFNLSGQALGIYKRNHIDMNQVVFSLDPQSVNLFKYSRLNISQGQFNLTGEDVTLTANKFKRRYIIAS